MRAHILLALVALLLAATALWSWGAIGASAAWLSGSMFAIGALLLVAFGYFTWRARWAGRGAVKRGWAAVIALALGALVIPPLAARGEVGAAFRNHADWFAPESDAVPAKAARTLGGWLASALGATPEDPSPDRLVSEGSSEGSAEGDGSGDHETGTALGSGTPPPEEGSAEVAHPSLDGSEPAGSGSGDGTTPVVVTVNEGSGADVPPEVSSTETASDDGSGEPAATEVPKPPDHSEEGPPLGALIPAVPPVQMSTGLVLWPSPSVPHAAALTAPDGATRNIATLSTWVGLEASEPWERVRIAHDWLALRIAQAPQDGSATIAVPRREERASLATAAFEAGQADSLGFASILAEVLAPLGIDVRVVVGGTPEERAHGVSPRAWNAVRIEDRWLFVDASSSAGCVPSELCDTPYSSAFLFAPLRASLRHHLPGPGSDRVYGDVDVTSLLRGPDLRASFFAAGLAVIEPTDGRVAPDAGRVRVVLERGGRGGQVRATSWDAGAAMSHPCDATERAGTLTFDCPAAGLAGGRIRVLGMTPDGWTWEELASWEYHAR